RSRQTGHAEQRRPSATATLGLQRLHSEISLDPPRGSSTVQRRAPNKHLPPSNLFGQLIEKQFKRTPIKDHRLGQEGTFPRLRESPYDLVIKTTMALPTHQYFWN